MVFSKYWCYLLNIHIFIKFHLSKHTMALVLHFFTNNIPYNGDKVSCAFSSQNADAAFTDATLISFFPAYIPRALFDISFFAIVTTVGLGVIFGIIIDTFSELRDEKVMSMYKYCN